MGRFLFVVPPLAERVEPTLRIGRDLAARGHDVAWALRLHLGPHGVSVVSTNQVQHDIVAAAAAVQISAGRCSPAGLLVFYDDYLLPLAHAMLPAVDAAVERFRPDVLVVDQHALAGAAVAYRRGLPWATLIPSSAGLADPAEDLPEVARQLRRRKRRLLRDAGLDDIAATRLDPHASPHLVIACTTEALAGWTDDAQQRCRHVGPCLVAPPAPVAFNWDRLDLDRPLVVITLETPHWHHATTTLYALAADAVRTLDVQAVIVGPPDLVLKPAANTVVVPRAPLRALMRSAAAVVCDAGHVTVCEALAHAVPLVVAPQVADQPVVASQAVRAGAAVRLPTNPTATRLRGAIQAVLTNHLLLQGAKRVADSFAHAGGPSAAADQLDALLTVTPISRSPL